VESSVPLTRRIAENRPVYTLLALIGFSVLSLASGSDGSILTRPIRWTGAVIASPIQYVLHSVQSGGGYVKDLLLDYNRSQRDAAALRTQLDSASKRLAEHGEVTAENRRLKEMLVFSRKHLDLDLIPASVVDEYEGILTIDKGSVHGIVINTSVLAPDGVVGVVIEALPLVSKVASLHRAECRIGAIIKRNRVHGMVHGSGFDNYDYVCSLQYIDLKEEVKIGDEVITGGGGGIYPSGYPIGRVWNVLTESGSLLKTAYIDPHVDPYRLDEVFLVRGALVPLDELSETHDFEPPPPPPDPKAKPRSVAPALPDTRSLQEQLAP
jgi:rod shape-determining protein MreC